MNIITRFAPSPTGLLHIGNIRTAVVNYLYAKKMNGQFMLRMDDTDLERSKDEYKNQILQDLEWLGLKWDIFAAQSERIGRYQEVRQHLIDIGRLYPCYESETELEVKRKMMLLNKKAPIYDRAALKLSALQIKEYEDKGIKPHYRFKLNDEKILLNDMVKGNLQFEARNLSDPVVIRADGSMTYMLCSVIDDIDYNITHIIRGEDHVTNSALQIQMFEALGKQSPVFGHLALITAKEKISKRIGGFDVDNMRKMGIEPMAISSMVAKMGTSDPIEIRQELKELVEEFDINKYSKSPTNYDANDLVNLNDKCLHHMPYNIACQRLKSENIDVISEEFWEAAKGNIGKLSDILVWYNICYKKITPTISEHDQEYLALALKKLPITDFNFQTWKEWTDAIAKETSRRGKAMFMPLRKALTGMEHGPEIRILLPFIARNTVIKRFQGEEC